MSYAHVDDQPLTDAAGSERSTGWVATLVRHLPLSPPPLGQLSTQREARSEIFGAANFVNLDSDFEVFLESA